MTISFELLGPIGIFFQRFIIGALGHHIAKVNNFGSFLFASLEDKVFHNGVFA